MGSSTQSELGGFTGAPLTLIQAISRYWGLKHRCKFYWMVDSKVAMAKVTVYSLRENMKYPDNSDYVSVICDIVKQLQQPIRHVWVKGRQDIGKHYNDLDYSARMNVDVDHLATNYLTSGHGKPMRSLPHIDASLTINDGRRYPGNLETNLRWHINGSYLKLYLQKQKGWSEQVWKTIDLHNFGSHFQSLLCPSQQVHQSKFCL